jgi:hypothetical protein
MSSNLIKKGEKKDRAQLNSRKEGDLNSEQEEKEYISHMPSEEENHACAPHEFDSY